MERRRPDRRPEGRRRGGRELEGLRGRWLPARDHRREHHPRAGGLKAIPKTLQQATIAIEDENFYEHDGVDFSAIIRATVENVEAGEIEQGASTITQQLVRNLYIKKPEDTFERKLTEAKWSMEFEEDYTKDEILEKYLNTATYGTNSGDTAVGVEAASQIYFNKSVEEHQPRRGGAPGRASPGSVAVQPVHQRGRGATSAATSSSTPCSTRATSPRASIRSGRDAGLGLERGLRYDQFRYRYFFDYVQQELIERYGTNTARVGGLEVYTTLDAPAPGHGRAGASGQSSVPTGAAAALVSTDAETGEIKAMASSSNYDDSEFNLAAQGKRQPGSSYKAFALTAAVEQGMDPDTTTYPAPGTITLNPCTGCPPWTVCGGGSGSMTLRSATANSINTVFAQLVIDIGPEAMNDTAHQAWASLLPPGTSVPEVLGAADVSVLEMSNAYATLANGGVHHDPTAINRVEFPNGDIDELDPSTGKRAFSDGVAYTVADVMKGALEYGTAAGQGIGCPASGKTGTTEAQSDAWFVGYTPHVSTAVWVGNPNERVPLPGYGADLAAPIWQDYMLGSRHRALRRLPRAPGPGRPLVLFERLRRQHAATRRLDDDTDRHGPTTRPDLKTPTATASTTTSTTPVPATRTSRRDGDGGGRPPANPGNGNPGVATPGGGGPRRRTASTPIAVVADAGRSARVAVQLAVPVR